MLRSFDSVTMGLEVHITPLTSRKLYSFSKPYEVGPIDRGEPGTMPAKVDEVALTKAIRLASLLKCDISSSFVASRKVYQYPDLPKGYQITQDSPIGVNGHLILPDSKTVIEIQQVHLEEDAAKTVNGKIDYSRAGMPLIEVVTKPVIHSIDVTIEFVKTLRSLAVLYSISPCHMEKGQMRADVNISVTGGARTEIKNLNSFKHISSALEYELNYMQPRQTQVTVAFEESTNTTTAVRAKEQSGDYLQIGDSDIKAIAIDPHLEDSVIKSRSAQLESLYNLFSHREIDNIIKHGSIEAIIEFLGTDNLTAPDKKHFCKSYLNINLKNRVVSAEEMVVLCQHLIRDEIGKGEIKRALLQEEKITPSVIKNYLYNAKEAEVTKVLQQVISNNSHLWTSFISGQDKTEGVLVGQIRKFLADNGMRTSAQTIKKIIKCYKESNG